MTNRDFKQFVDHGGYEDPAFWTELARAAGESAGKPRGADRFRDRTGRPGPATWELGGYPEGEEDHPVGGLSWFEAAAYCASLQKSLHPDEGLDEPPLGTEED